MSVTLSTTSGTLSASTVTLNPSGIGYATLTSGRTGTLATVTARLNAASATKKVVMHRASVTATPQIVIYDPDSPVAARREPVIDCTIGSTPAIATHFSVRLRFFDLKGAVVHVTPPFYARVGKHRWTWSSFFSRSEFPMSGMALDPGRGIYPYQIEATVDASMPLNEEYLNAHGIGVRRCSHDDARASRSLEITWTKGEISYNEAASRTELDYQFRIYNGRRAAPPVQCRIDIYDPNYNIIRTIPIATSAFRPHPQMASTFLAEATVPFLPPTAGEYHFVVEAQQSNHPDEDKDAGKWALERNSGATAPPYFVSTTQAPGGNEAGVPGVLDTRAAPGSQGRAGENRLQCQQPPDATVVAAQPARSQKQLGCGVCCRAGSRGRPERPDYSVQRCVDVHRPRKR
jgi:hypothetical protein